MHRYADKVVLVTGAAGGLGKAITLRLASEGALVVATDLDSERLAAAFPATADSILKIHCLPLDVTNYLAFAQLVAECGFHAIRPPSPLSSGQAFQGHLATCSTAIRPGSRSAATQGWHC
ncbi:SDR family NAD(P)-dependent oxidoreductase [Pseudomonas putida]|uniref:SDR family NAD(P)-dependent oxidoreductase n=1 Tax=Pseudomonas putida TaxID=303 RepID=UPI002DBCB569|nr:SDR family NAD(P)-dependent oxidoreductase [Pseudomonas putida]WRW04765.1 SDR family NAD(P)-dependent oxidoreductase [Pseudomonas putida]